MNYALAKEIYGLTPWFVDAHSLPGLLGILEHTEALEIPDVQYNTPFLLALNSTKVPSSKDPKIIDRPYGSAWFPGQLETREDFEAVAVVKINGPITLNGGASSLGMNQVSDLMNKMAADDRVKAFIILANSGGGASAAVQVMSDTINTIKDEKPVFGCIEKGGMAASAMYGILSACDKIYSEAPLNIVGSAGTMIQFKGREANTEDPDGNKHIRLYASKSTRKNEAFEAALNNDNYKLLIDNLLDPVNESFLNLIESNRPVLKGTNFDDGHTVFSSDAVGSFIDGIKSFSDVVEEITSGENFTKKGSTFNNLNNNSMTKAELKSKHPELYNSIYNEGVSAEADRSGAWLAHFGTDPDAVLEGINSGEAITSKQTQEFIVKQASQAQLANLAADSPESVATAAAGKGKKPGEGAEDEVDSFYAGVDSKLNLKK
jgi:ClpP class serine protease